MKVGNMKYKIIIHDIRVVFFMEDRDKIKTAINVYLDKGYTVTIKPWKKANGNFSTIEFLDEWKKRIV